MDLTVVGGGFVGEGAALLAAFLWAAATLLFGRIGQQLPPLALNLVKGMFAIALICLTLALRIALSTASQPFGLTPRSTFFLILSGAVGIGLGDTAYFAAINSLGARKALLLETLAPPMTAVLAWIFLSETLPLTAISGILLTLIGIAWVISERVPEADGATQSRALRPADNKPTELIAGLQIALLAVFCQASGAVLSRAALMDLTVDPLWSSLLRLLAGMAFMAALAVYQPQRIRWQTSLAALKVPSMLGAVAVAAFFGTYLGIWLQQIALKYALAGVAQALLATSPLFVLPMAAILGDRMSLRAVLGVAIALIGVWLLLYIG